MMKSISMQHTVLLALVLMTDAFLNRPLSSTLRFSKTPAIVLSSGVGIATNYTWKEEAFEIELTVRVPRTVTSKDILFQATANSLSLNYTLNDQTMTLLDPSRPLRGRVNLDGTYWMMGDHDTVNNTRLVTVTIDKYMRTPNSDFEAVEFDWKGVYKNDNDEVTERTYDGAEPLNVRDYAGRMGVDIDHLNMSMVDKTMFSSGLNVSQSALEEMRQAGYISKDQITQQGDGKEFLTDEETGEAVPYSLEKAIMADKQQVVKDNTIHQQVRNFTRAAFAQDAAVSPPSSFRTKDPILEMPLERLQEILKSQGLPVDGDEDELRERLRMQVNTLLQKGS